MTKYNIGIFRMDAKAIRENPDRIAAIFSLLKVVIVKAELLFSSDTVEYVGISPFFRERIDYYDAPCYLIITINDAEGWPKTVEAREVKAGY
jgi:hypothetical protein